MIDNSPYVTRDWHRANASIAILYVYHLKGAMAVAQQQCLERLRQCSPAFRHDGGRRHFFIFSNDRGPCCIDGRYKDVEFMRHRIIGNGEQNEVWHRYPRIGQAAKLECHDPAKDISIPPPAWHSPRVQNAKDLPAVGEHNRSLLLFFAGFHNLSPCRQQLVATFARDMRDPTVLIVRNLSQSRYVHANQRARFCPVCGGFAPWTPRIAEIMYHECVPIFLSDEFLPPFSTTLNWSKFSARLSISKVHTLKSFAASLDHRALRDGERRARPTFEYLLSERERSGPQEGSPNGASARSHEPAGVLPLLIFEMARSLQTPVKSLRDVVPVSNTISSGLPKGPSGCSAMAMKNAKGVLPRPPVQASAVYEVAGQRWHCATIRTDARICQCKRLTKGSELWRALQRFLGLIPDGSV